MGATQIGAAGRRKGGREGGGAERGGKRVSHLGQNMPIPCSIVFALLIPYICSCQAMFGPSSSQGGAKGTSSDSLSGDPVTALRREVGLPPPREAQCTTVISPRGGPDAGSMMADAI